MIERRTFLKLATAVVGALTVTKYAEPLELLKESGKWI